MKPAFCLRLILLLGAAAGGSALAAAAEVDRNRIVIGQSIGLTGPVAAVAGEIVDGLGAAFAEINQRGGVQGKKLELLTVDDGFDPQRARENTLAFRKSGQVFALAGSLGTPQTAEIIKALSDGSLPLLCPFSGADSVRTPHPLVFHLRAGYRDEANKMVEQLTTLGMQRIAVFYQNDSFGQEGLSYVQDALQQRGLKPVALAAIERGSLEVKKAVDEIARADPQGIIAFVVTRPAAEFVKQLRAIDGFQQVITISTNANEDFIKALGEQGRGVANTQVVPDPWNNGLPVVREYQQAMRQFGRERFSPNSLEAYLCGKLIAEGVRRIARDPAPEKFVAALESMSDFDLGGFTVRYSPRRHVASSYVDMTVIGAKGKMMR